MYSGWQRGKAPSGEWTEQTTEFLDHAFSLLGVAENETTKCPCAMCRNYFKHKRHTIELHLCKYGFKEGYEIWTEHGESHVSHDDFFDQRKTTHRKINNQSTSGVSFVEPDPSLSPEDPSC